MAFSRPKFTSAPAARRRAFMAQPYRHPSSGKFYIRRKVPADLREALGREFKRSLDTLDPTEAKGRFAAAWSESEQAFALARAGLRGDETLSQETIQKLAAQWFGAEVQRLERSKDFAGALAVERSGIADDGEEYTLYAELAQVCQLSTHSPTSPAANPHGCWVSHEK